MKNVLLYGGGTQSTGLLLMSLEGMFPYWKPDMAIFADTYSEPEFVMEYIFKVREYVLEKYDFLIRFTWRTGPGLAQDILQNDGGRIASLPVYTGNGGMVRRQCTEEYKIRPVTNIIKEKDNIGRKRKGSVPVVNRIFGISLDEIERCRESTDWWAVNKYPLVEARMKRFEVIDYINTHHPEIAGPKRSSCYFCPFHSDDYWRRLKEKHPGEFTKAIEIDEKIRRKRGLDNDCFLHRSCKPLKDIDFSKDSQLEIFGECEGYCGI